jgi:hypothetical protein
MRVTGDLEIIRQIDEIIKTQTKHDVVKGEYNPQPCNVEIEQSLQTIHYRVYILPYEFSIRIVYDHRNHSGQFHLPDPNSQFFFIAYPKIVELLSQLDSMLFRYKTNDGMKNDKIKGGVKTEVAYLHDTRDMTPKERFNHIKEIMVVHD